MSQYQQQFQQANTLLWQKDGSEPPDAEMMAFLAGDDVVLDRQLFLYDVEATKAHIGGLGRIAVLTSDEVDSLRLCLDDLAQRYQQGEYILDVPFEDSHSAIEAFVTQQLGEVGQKIHTGRSRNDQVLVATRLYLKQQLATLRACCLHVIEVLLARAQQDEMMPMPGYTHLQRAVPSSVGLWLGAYAESFVDNVRHLDHVLELVDQCPLGAAAGYGVNLPLDREGVAAELGFAKVQNNAMYVQNSRGKFELLALQALGQVTLDVRRLAWDLSLYTSSEFDFVRLPAALRTGSSIMPNKSNPDLIELLRALHPMVLAGQVELDAILALPSAYHRDMQASKPALLRPWVKAQAGLSLLAKMLGQMTLVAESLAEAMEEEMLATDRAIHAAVASGGVFRRAYGESMDKGEPIGSEARDLEGDIEQSLKDRVSPGGCGDLGLQKIHEEFQWLVKNQSQK
jgi:argininosuccinate lyase